MLTRTVVKVRAEENSVLFFASTVLAQLGSLDQLVTIEFSCRLIPLITLSLCGGLSWPDFNKEIPDFSFLFLSVNSWVYVCSLDSSAV